MEQPTYTEQWFQETLIHTAQWIDRTQWQHTLREGCQDDPLGSLRAAASANGSKDLEAWALEIARLLSTEVDDVRMMIGYALNHGMGTHEGNEKKYDCVAVQPALYAEGWASHILGQQIHQCPYNARTSPADIWENGQGQRSQRVDE